MRKNKLKKLKLKNSIIKNKKIKKLKLKNSIMKNEKIRKCVKIIKKKNKKK